MFDKTDHAYGVNEVLMLSALAGVVFGLFSGQPLCIVGVTGPISIFSYTVYELIHPRGTPYFPFMCWVYLLVNGFPYNYCCWQLYFILTNYKSL